MIISIPSRRVVPYLEIYQVESAFSTLKFQNLPILVKTLFPENQGLEEDKKLCIIENL